MKNTIISICIILSAMVGASVRADASAVTIEDVQFKIYDYSSSKIHASQLNPYGNDMALFVVVKLMTIKEEYQKYTLKLKGSGEGRENEAEGVVEDYALQTEKGVELYGGSPRYIPFILEYPCTSNVLFDVEVWDGGKRITAEKVKGLSGCVLN